MTDFRSDEMFDDADELALQMAAIQPRLYGFILKRLADREQTLEVLQRTNLVLCRKADQFDRGSSFAAWAFTVAKFQVMAWRKSEGATRLIFTDRVVELLDRSTDDEVASVDQRIPVLRQCLQRLKDADRELIQRRYRDAQAIEPIAQSLSATVDAVAMRLSRIRKQLARCVELGLNQEGLS